MSDPLANSPLSWSRAGVGRVQINHEGRPVSIVGGRATRSVVDRLQTASEAEGQQLLAGLMAEGRKNRRR